MSGGVTGFTVGAMTTNRPFRVRVMFKNGYETQWAGIYQIQSGEMPLNSPDLEGATQSTNFLYLKADEVLWLKVEPDNG